jgi:hypothetical protein
MIRTLTSISELSIIDQRTSENITIFQKIVFDDTNQKKGGFATVYPISSIDDTPSGDKYLLKISWVNDKPDADYRVTICCFLWL